MKGQVAIGAGRPLGRACQSLFGYMTKWLAIDGVTEREAS